MFHRFTLIISQWFKFTNLLYNYSNLCKLQRFNYNLCKKLGCIIIHRVGA